MYEHIRNYQDIAEKTAFFYTTIFLGLGRAAEFIIKLQRFAETPLQLQDWLKDSRTVHTH